MQKITPFLWFNGNVAEAIDFYTDAFKNSQILNVRPFGRMMPGQEDKIFTATFQLEDQQLMALDGGPRFKFTPSVSFFVSCDTVQEIDELWKKLSDGGMAFMELNKYPFSEKFGWVQDKFGLSWQLNLAHREHKITPFLMYVGKQHGRAEEAIKFYTSLFPNSKIEYIQHLGTNERGQEGEVKHAAFNLDGQDFMAMDSNGAHDFNFTEAQSFFVNCTSQQEVDQFWNKFLEDGEESMCGWLKDKFGVSWQIIPDTLGKLLSDPDPEKAQKVMQAMLKMRKIDINKLQEAHDTALVQ
jgi:predicted 3-demethylubiquinone-9 3-methyltransferase (glyoxalase superfamily)